MTYHHFGLEPFQNDISSILRQGFLLKLPSCSCSFTHWKVPLPQTVLATCRSQQSFRAAHFAINFQTISQPGLGWMQNPKSWSSTWWSISRALWGVNFQLRTATFWIDLLHSSPHLQSSLRALVGNSMRSTSCNIEQQKNMLFYGGKQRTVRLIDLWGISHRFKLKTFESRAASKQGRVCLCEILIHIDANSFWIMLRSNISMNSQETCTKTSTFAFLITAKLGSASCAWKGSLVYWINFCICRMGKSIRYKTTNISMIWLQDQPFATTPCVRISSYS